MRKLISKIAFQFIALLLLLSATTFWFGYINARSIFIYGATLIIFAILISDLWSLFYIVAFALATAIVIPIIPKLHIVPGARALIAVAIYGALFLVATLIISNQGINKHNGKDYDNSGKQS